MAALSVKILQFEYSSMYFHEKIGKYWCSFLKEIALLVNTFSLSSAYNDDGNGTEAHTSKCYFELFAHSFSYCCAILISPIFDYKFATTSTFIKKIPQYLVSND